MTDRADLVVVGAGTVGGWASVFAKADGARAGRRRGARAGRDGRVVAGGRHRPGAGRHARDRRPRPLDDRLLQRPGGGLRHGLRLPRARLPDPRGHRGGRAGRPRARRDAAGEGLAVRWLDAAEAATTAGTLSPDGHRGGSYLETDGHIDPPRNVRAYSLAMQAAGVELRERTTFTGLRTTPAPDGGSRVTAVETDARRHRDRARAADRRADRCAPSARRPACGSRPARSATRSPCSSRMPAFAVDRAADGLRHRRRPVLAARGGRPALRLERPRRRAGRGPPHRLGVLRADARAAGRVRAGHARARPAPDLGGHHRLHARPPADPRPGARRRRERHRGRDRRLAGRARDDVGAGRRPGRRGPGRPRPDRPGGRDRTWGWTASTPTVAAASRRTRSRCRSRCRPGPDQSRSGGSSQRSVPTPARSGRSMSMRSIAPLRIGRCEAPQSRAASSLKSGSWPTSTGRTGSPASVQDGVEVLRLEGLAQARVDPDREPEVERDELGGAVGADLGRRDDGVRDEADAGQERPEPVRLALALLGERPGRVEPLERRAVAGMRRVGAGRARS